MASSSGSSRPPCRQPVIIALSVTEAHPQPDTQLTTHRIKQTRGRARSQEEEEEEEEGCQARMSDGDRKPRGSWDIRAPRSLIVTDKHEVTTPTARRHIATQWQQLVSWRKKGWLKQRELEICISRITRTHNLLTILIREIAGSRTPRGSPFEYTNTHTCCGIAEVMHANSAPPSPRFHKHTPTLLIYDWRGPKRGHSLITAIKQQEVDWDFMSGRGEARLQGTKVQEGAANAKRIKAREWKRILTGKGRIESLGGNWSGFKIKLREVRDGGKRENFVVRLMTLSVFHVLFMSFFLLFPHFLALCPEGAEARRRRLCSFSVPHSQNFSPSAPSAPEASQILGANCEGLSSLTPPPPLYDLVSHPRPPPSKPVTLPWHLLAAWQKLRQASCSHVCTWLWQEQNHR